MKFAEIVVTEETADATTGIVSDETRSTGNAELPVTQ